MRLRVDWERKILAAATILKRRSRRRKKISCAIRVDGKKSQQQLENMSWERNKNQQRAARTATEGMRTDRESPMKTTRNRRLHASGRSGPLMVHFDRRHKSERKKSSCAKRSRAEQPDQRIKGEKQTAAEPLRGTEYFAQNKIAWVPIDRSQCMLRQQTRIKITQSGDNATRKASDTIRLQKLIFHWIQTKFIQSRSRHHSHSLIWLKIKNGSQLTSTLGNVKMKLESGKKLQPSKIL
jgi:hypothetical protein